MGSFGSVIPHGDWMELRVPHGKLNIMGVSKEAYMFGFSAVIAYVHRSCYNWIACCGEKFQLPVIYIAIVARNLVILQLNVGGSRR